MSNIGRTILHFKDFAEQLLKQNKGLNIILTTQNTKKLLYTVLSTSASNSWIYANIFSPNLGPRWDWQKKTHDTVSLNTLQLTTPLVNNSIAGPFNSLCICQKHCLPNWLHMVWDSKLVWFGGVVVLTSWWPGGNSWR